MDYIQPLLFIHPVTMLLPVDYKHSDHFSKCTDAPRSLSRGEVEIESGKRTNSLIPFLGTDLDEMRVVYSIVDEVEEDVRESELIPNVLRLLKVRGQNQVV